MTTTQRNWAGNHTFSAAHLHYPETVEQVQALVRRADKVHVLGSRHSFNDIADTTGDLISLERLDNTLAIDPKRNVVTVNGGITYGELGRQLHRAGYALPNMASLPHITVVGACATATHGSGDSIGNLATAVAGLELVTANGDVTVLSREQDGDQFQGAVVNLGALGVVTKVTLDIVPTYAVHQAVYENMPSAQVEANFDAITAAAYSVSFFTDWQNDVVSQVWLKHQSTNDQTVALAPSFFEATLAPTHRHPVTARPADACTEQMGIPGPWHDRLPHFRIDSTLTGGHELQTEYFVPRQHAVAAMRAVAGLQQAMAPVLLLSEVRTIAADSLWLSPAYQQATIGLHFSWHHNWPVVQQVLPLLEEGLAPYQARPHWGKLFTMTPAHLQTLYPKLPDFRNLLHHYDPQGKFRNAFLDSYIMVGR